MQFDYNRDGRYDDSYGRSRRRRPYYPVSPYPYFNPYFNPYFPVNPIYPPYYQRPPYYRPPYGGYRNY
ncbi:hypothetical protein JOD29_002125 [Lysinibacillus composti]|uniref:Spore coat protein n=1 Tax=Lysinibacillus composti TaxID=720633 RepID=A0A3N9UDL2_9BACI|nr:spore coat protein [Lysinibacillus composti]MBM7608859.1 hypothetical protein [Lysinibacillus composti]RQW74439.1 spore coat protein [Lysinibacillus composti]